MKTSILSASIGIALMLIASTSGQACTKATSAEHAMPRNVASKDAPALVELLPGGEPLAPQALELTVRATKLVPASPYLVRVFAGDTGIPPDQIIANGQLLGSFSLFGVAQGQIENYIVDPPADAVLASGRPISLAIELIPASATADLGANVLEVVSAQLVE